MKNVLNFVQIKSKYKFQISLNQNLTYQFLIFLSYNSLNHTEIFIKISSFSYFDEF